MSDSESCEIINLLVNLIEYVDVQMNQEVGVDINGQVKDVANCELLSIGLTQKDEAVKPKLKDKPQEGISLNKRFIYESVIQSPYSLTWFIPNFNQQEGPLVSPPFIDRKGRKFNLQIFPKGDSHTVDDHISICICPDRDSNVQQDSVEKPPKVRFILWAMKPNGYRHTLIENESQLTEKEYYRETITLQEIGSKGLLWDERLKLHFQFCARLRKEPQPAKMTKKRKRYARSLSPSEIPNDPPEEAIPKQEFISSGPNPTGDLQPYSFTWIIPNFSQQEGPLVSPPFIDRKNRRFTMLIWPKGDSQTVDDHISICICPDLYSFVSQDSEDKVRFILWAFSPNRSRYKLFESESLLTKKEYFREAITLKTLQRLRLLDGNRLELLFHFCAKLRKEPQLNNEPKSEKRLARSLSPSEIPNDPPKKKQKLENSISNAVTKTQPPNETQNEPMADVVMSTLDGNAKEEFISTGPKPTDNLQPYSYTWTIPNFSQQERPFVSPTFVNQQNRRFNLRICPKGDSQTVDDFLCICICPDEDSNVRQDSEDKIRFILWAIKENGKRFNVLNCQSQFMEKESFREAITLKTLQDKKLLCDDQLKLQFQLCRKKEPKLNNEPKSEKRLARSLSPSEIPNDPPKKKQENTQEDLPKEEFISTGPNPTIDEPPYSCTWTIPNFTKKKGQLVSPTFTDQHNRRFNLEILPKGDSKNRADFFSICLCPDKDFNAVQDSEENLKNVRFILAAVDSTGARRPLLDCQGPLTEKYFRRPVNTLTIRRKGFLDGNRLKLHFQFSGKLKKKTKKAKKLARIQMNEEIRKMKKESQRKTRVITRSQTRNATGNEPKSDVLMHILDVDVPNERNLITVSTASESRSKPEIEIITID